MFSNGWGICRRLRSLAFCSFSFNNFLLGTRNCRVAKAPASARLRPTHIVSGRAPVPPHYSGGVTTRLGERPPRPWHPGPHELVAFAIRPHALDTTLGGSRHRQAPPAPLS